LRVLRAVSRMHAGMLQPLAFSVVSAHDAQAQGWHAPRKLQTRSGCCS
jgi:hypothetical protein